MTHEITNMIQSRMSALDVNDIQTQITAYAHPCISHAIIDKLLLPLDNVEGEIKRVETIVHEQILATRLINKIIIRRTW